MGVPGWPRGREASASGTWERKVEAARGGWAAPARPSARGRAVGGHRLES